MSRRVAEEPERRRLNEGPGELLAGLGGLLTAEVPGGDEYWLNRATVLDGLTALSSLLGAAAATVKPSWYAEYAATLYPKAEEEPWNAMMARRRLESARDAAQPVESSVARRAECPLHLVDDVEAVADDEERPRAVAAEPFAPHRAARSVQHH